MHLPSALLLALTALSAVHARRAVAVSPQTSLQDRRHAREMVQSRQTSSREVVRRSKRTPKQRRASPGVCADVGGQPNKIQDGDFEDSETNDAIWPITSDSSESFTASLGPNYGYAPTSSSYGLLVGKTSSDAAGSASISQAVTVCVDATYELTFDSGKFSDDNEQINCPLTISIGADFSDTFTPCGFDHDCGMASGGGAPSSFRSESYTYTPSEAGTIDIKFQVVCASTDGIAATVLDNISFKRIALV